MKIIKDIHDPRTISNINDWKGYCLEKMLGKEKDEKETKKKFCRQWEDNKSSPMLAKYWLEKDKDIKFQNILTKLIGKEIVFEAGIPEYEARFDEFSSPRQHDLFIYTLNYNTIISVEAKSGENWKNYNKFCEEYHNAKEDRKKQSKKLERCKKLLKDYFCEKESDINDIVYQILTWFAGSLADATRFKSKNIIMLCQQFDVDNNITKDNEEEFNKFIKFISNDSIKYTLKDNNIKISEPINNKYTKYKDLYLMHLIIQSNGT